MTLLDSYKYKSCMYVWVWMQRTQGKKQPRITHDMTWSCVTWPIHRICGMTPSYVTWPEKDLHVVMSGACAESCHIWMSHVTHECVMSHMNVSCHIWTSHVTYERVMRRSLVRVCVFQWVVSHVTHERVMYTWRSHETYKKVMSHTNKSYHEWKSHVAYERLISCMHYHCRILSTQIARFRFQPWIFHVECDKWTRQTIETA